MDRPVIVLMVLLTLVGLHGAKGGPLATRGAADSSVTSGSWTLTAQVSMGSLKDSLLTFGVRADASPDYDPIYDIPHPPDPPGDFVEAYFPHTGGSWPMFLGFKFAHDIASPVSPSWEFVVQSSLASGWMTISWDTNDIRLLPGPYAITMKDSTADSVFSIRNCSSYAFHYSAPRIFLVRVDFQAQWVMTQPGWNMVSVPRVLRDFRKVNVFPSARSAAFEFKSSYRVVDTLRNGAGYWVKFDQAEMLGYPGASLPSVSLSLKKGWNMVGAPDHPIPTPAGPAFVSQWFTYAGSYVPADSLQPGSAYWIKAALDTSIVPGASSISAMRLPAESEPAILQLDLFDRSGARQTLSICQSAIASDGDRYQLPPAPPFPGFDARFRSQTFREIIPNRADVKLPLTVDLQSAAYPVTIDAHVLPGWELSVPSADCRYVGGASGASGFERWLVADPEVHSISFVLRKSWEQPNQIVLQQNYPNPFNASSLIRYSLPAAMHVRLLLVDLLGREIHVLRNGIEEAGLHRVEVHLSSGDLPSGIYWCRLEATSPTEGERQVKTMKILYLK